MTTHRLHGLATALLLVVPLLFGCAESQSSDTADAPNPLLQPSRFRETAPDAFRVRLTTTRGEIVVEVTRAWAPRGVDRFYNLVKAGFYDGVPFHRVMEGQWAQFGINPDPYVNVAWRERFIADDEAAGISNTRGRVVFANAGRDTRTVQVFINLGDNPGLDNDFFPFGEVTQGMDVADALFSGYGDGPPRGEGVYQAMAEVKGDEYFAEFPELDRIIEAHIEAS